MPLDRTSEPLDPPRGRVARRFVAIFAGMALAHLPVAQVQAQFSDAPFPDAQGAYAAPSSIGSVPPGSPYGVAPTAPAFGPPQNLPPELPPTPFAPGASGPAASTEEVPLAEGEVFESAKVVARVGRETILAGDILGMVNQQIQAAEKTVPKEHLAAFQKEAEKFRRNRMSQLTQLCIEMKLLYFDFLRLVPPDRQIELKNKIGASFREHEAPRMMESFEVDSEEALDAKLREFGSSLKKAQQLYIEKTLGMILLRQKVDENPKISHQELLDLYEAKKASYFRPARVKYEELVVKFARFPSKGDAWAELADMGNEVLRGAPLSAVAKRRSQGIGAATSGGQQDWTGRGSLVTTKVEEALFQIQPGKLSEIIEDGDSFYIVRVQEREGERYTPFAEVQDDLREEIKQEKIGKAQEEYILGLYERTHVWNAFEHDNVQSIADRRREFLKEDSAAPSHLMSKNDKPKGGTAGYSAKPDAAAPATPGPIPGGGSFEPAPSDFQPSPAPGGVPSAGGGYEFR